MLFPKHFVYINLLNPHYICSKVRYYLHFKGMRKLRYKEIKSPTAVQVADSRFEPIQSGPSLGS